MTELERPPTLLEPEYVAGLFDTTGSFTVRVGNGETSLDYYIDPVVKLNIPQDGYLSQHIESFFESYEIKTNTQSHQDSSNICIIQICNNDDIKTVGEAVGPFLIAERESAILLIEEIIPRVENDLYDSKEIFYKTMGYADDIREWSTDDLEYTQKYFADLWSDELSLSAIEQDD